MQSPGGTLPRPIDEDEGPTMSPKAIRILENFEKKNRSLGDSTIDRDTPILNSLYEELSELYSSVYKNNKYGLNKFAIQDRINKLGIEIKNLQRAINKLKVLLKKQKESIDKLQLVREYSKPQSTFLENMIKEMEKQYSTLPAEKVFKNTSDIRKFKERLSKLNVKEQQLEELSNKTDSYIRNKKEIRSKYRLLNKKKELLEKEEKEFDALKEAEIEQKNIKIRIKEIRTLITKLKGLGLHTFKPFQQNTLSTSGRTFFNSQRVEPTFDAMGQSLKSLSESVEVIDDNIIQKQQKIITEARGIVNKLKPPDDSYEKKILEMKKRIEEWIQKANIGKNKPILTPSPQRSKLRF